jgi:synaptic vesicle membrane protein VAT-1
MNMQQTMRSVVIKKPGTHQQIVIENLPRPACGPDQILIDVAAIGVNYADCIIRMGLYASAKQLHGYPITPGFEIAGRVAQVGANVSGFVVGEEVIGLTLFGGYCECIALTADRVFKSPQNVSTSQGAALPTVYLTAWFCVHELSLVRAGQRVLVHSAAGGVGGALVQLCKLAGAKVIGVVGRETKVATAKSLGCDRVVVKSKNMWRELVTNSTEKFDVIFDANGVETLSDSYRHLAPAGKLVIYGFHTMLPKNGRLNWFKLAWFWLRTPRFSPLDMTQANKSVLACNLSFLSAKSELLRTGMLWLLERFSSGVLSPPTVTTFALEQVVAAHKLIESGNSVGKLVLMTAAPTSIDSRSNQA